MLEISFIPKKEFDRILKSNIDEFKKLQILGDTCRLNALSAVKKAGSGHLGSSLSSIDVILHLYLYEMNVLRVGIKSSDRDIFFSSKGHDCPGFYSILAALGIIDFDMLLKLRRLGGLDGHPEIHIPGVEANSGSLGMGISKAKGMAFAKKLKDQGGRIFVMTGDGELQEGQIWESMQTAAYQGINNICAIVDHNKIQTDKPIRETIDLDDLEGKFKLFGWHVERCDGHDFKEIADAFAKLKKVTDRPKILIADTVKGKGISFMEGDKILKRKNELYKWHSGAPDDDFYEKGYKEILNRINGNLDKAGLKTLAIKVVDTREKNRIALKDIAEKVVNAYSESLVEWGEKRKDIVVLDADLAGDCGLRQFASKFPERFIENGIAEQDMVSAAGGLALQGLLPIVNSFGVFLASRANEQIYNNATEKTKIIYVCHFAGLIPAGPGKSHQSVRDISLFGALPNCTIIEPCNAVETKKMLEWCVDEAKETCMMRLVISPSPRTIELPKDYKLNFGRGTVLRDGKDAVLFAYGPVMLNEALLASELLENKNFSLKIVDMPWLNRVDGGWLIEAVGDCKTIFVLDNHSSYGGLGDSLLNSIILSDELKAKKFKKFALEEYPACGTPQEVLRYHGLDGVSIAKRIFNNHK